jgi:hypothetical protein
VSDKPTADLRWDKVVQEKSCAGDPAPCHKNHSEFVQNEYEQEIKIERGKDAKYSTNVEGRHRKSAAMLLFKDDEPANHESANDEEDSDPKYSEIEFVKQVLMTCREVEESNE